MQTRILSRIDNALRMLQENSLDTFHDSTYADWKTAQPPDREPDFTSPSGSQYWYTAQGCYRRSDHWLWAVKSCAWTLDGKPQRTSEPATGFCRWEDFQKIVPLTVMRDKSVYVSPYRTSLGPQDRRISAIRTLLDRRGNVVMRSRQVFDVTKETAEYIVLPSKERVKKSTLSHSFRVT